jgi:outer membrane biosynthesis protein TonB
MSKFVAMDQSEKVGLGAAVGGHVLLLALLVLGLFRAAAPLGSDGGGSGDGIAVEIVSEGAVAEPDPAPPVAQEVEEVEEVEDIPVPVTETVVDPVPVVKPVQKVQPKPNQLVKPKVKSPTKPITKPAAKTITKPVQKPVKTATVTGRGGGKSDFEKQMEQKLGGLGGGGTGNTPQKGKGEGAGKGESIKTAGQISKEVNAVLGPKILRFVRQCAPSGVDVNRIITTVTINLSVNGGVTSLSGISQRGITDNNRAQAQPMERCVTGAIRKAAPFTELNAKDYDGWKSHRMSFQPN